MSTPSQQNNNTALSVLTALFFMMGFITCLNDILIPHLKAIFDLSYVQAMLVQFCFFTAYAVMSIPMGKLVGKIGYKGGVIGGFLLTAVGCLLFYPAADSASYPTFLAALFILASGVTLLQVAGNPYVTLLSRPGKESSTLTLVQAFNSLGTTVAPWFGSMLILADAGQTASKAEQISSVQIPYLGLAGVLILLAVFVKMIKLPDARKLDFGRARYFLLCRCGSIYRVVAGQRNGSNRRTGSCHRCEITVGILGRRDGGPLLGRASDAAHRAFQISGL